MASILTQSGVAATTYLGKHNWEVFMKPLFIGENPLTKSGIRVIPNVKSVQYLNYIGALNKILIAYEKGFNAATGVNYTQRALTVYQMKAEASMDAQEFYQTVFEEVLKTGVDWNDIQGTDVEPIILALFRNAVESDIFRQVWLNETVAETAESGYFSGTDDENYNSFDGLWKLLIDNCSTTPTLGTHIKKIDINSTTYLTTAGVKQKQTATMTGTSGTANLLINGINYLATFTTDLTTTCANFVTSHAAALLLRKITCTSSTNTIILESTIPGMTVNTVTVTNATGNLAGSVAATTANVKPVYTKTDGSLAVFKAMFEDMQPVLRQVYAKDKNQLLFLVTSSVYDNYASTVETGAHDGAWKVKQEGVEKLYYRGIEVVDAQWNAYLTTTDFPADYMRDRAILTAKNNLVVGTDAADDYAKTQFWFNMDEQEDRMRTQLRLGVQYVHADLTVIAFV
jgi:hypothetical protein